MNDVPGGDISQSCLQTVPAIGFHRIEVPRLVHLAVQIDIIAEVGARDRLTLVSLDLVAVGFGDHAIAVHVPDEEAERHIRRPAASIDARDLDGHGLHIGHAGKRNPHFVTAEGRRAGRGRATDDLSIT